MKNTNNILFIGDLHGEFAPVFEAVNKFQPEAVIMLGDQQPEEPMDGILKDVSCPVWWILGNHDSDQQHFLTNHFSFWNFNLGNRKVEIGGLKIAGLGGEFRQEVWHPWDGEGKPKWNRRQDYLTSLAPNADLQVETPENCFHVGLPLRGWTAIFPEDLDILLDQGPADILVSHMAPDWHEYGFKEINELAELLEVKTIIHGHLHRSRKITLDNGIEVVSIDKGSVFEFSTDNEVVFKNRIGS